MKRTFNLSVLALVFAVMLTACGGGGGGGGAATAPAAPSNLSAVATSSGSIDLAWTDGSDNEESFKIERGTDGATFTQVGTVTGNTLTYSDTGLDASTKYYYRVCASNSAGDSGYSNVADATTQAAPVTAPAAPSNLGATAVSSSGINLAWTDNADNEEGFKIERSTDGAIFSQTATVAANVTSYSDTGLTASTTYHYRVRAYNSAGNSAYSSVANATTQAAPTAAPAAPSNLSATAVSTTGINLAWTDNSNNETGFKIERGTDGMTFSQIGTVNAAVAVYSDSGLTSATTYYYKVRAYNDIGNSGYTNIANALTQGAPAYPRFAYVANYHGGTISIYTVNAETGQLRHNGYARAGLYYPTSVTMHPSGKFAYAANSSSPGTISAYTIDQTTGALTPVTSAPTVTAGDYPESVTVDPSGKFAYAANYVSPGTISAYTIDQTSGALTEVTGSPFAAGEGPESITVHPSGKFAYAANNASDDISIYAIDQTSGALISRGTATAGNGPSSIAVDPMGRFAYTADNWSISAFTINQTTGALTEITGSPYTAGDGAHSVTVDPSGKFAYTENNGYTISIYAIDQTAGALTKTGTISTREAPESIAMAGGAAPVKYVPKFAYAANAGSNTVSAYAINQSTGALTEVSSAPTGTRPQSVAVYPSGKFAYVTNTNADSLSSYSIQADGALISAGTVTAGDGPTSVVVDPSGQFAYAANFYSGTISAYSIDQTTGALISAGTATAGNLPTSVVVDPSGRFVYATNRDSGNISVYTIQTTGVLVSAGTATAGTWPFSVAVDPSGRFVYAANYNSGNISAYTIDQNTGILTSVVSAPTTTAGTNPRSVAVDPSGKYVYVANQGGDVSQYMIGEDGSLSPMTSPTVAAGTNPYSVTVDPSGKYAYVANYFDGVGGNSVSQYMIGADGALTPMTTATVPAGTQPFSITTTGAIE